MKVPCWEFKIRKRISSSFLSRVKKPRIQEQPRITNWASVLNVMSWATERDGKCSFVAQGKMYTKLLVKTTSLWIIISISFPPWLFNWHNLNLGGNNRVPDTYKKTSFDHRLNIEAQFIKFTQKTKIPKIQNYLCPCMVFWQIFYF